MANDVFTLACLLCGIGVGVLFLWVGIKSLRKGGMIKKTPTSKIGSISSGLVEISGEVHPCHDLLESPFSHQSCVYYQYAVEKYRWGHTLFRWKEIKGGEERTYFFLKDETGMVLVDPKEAEMSISPSYEFISPFGKEPQENTGLFLKFHDIDYKGFWGINKKMRFGESLILPGGKLFIMGHAAENPFIKDGLSNKNKANFMIRKGEAPFFISDQPERGALKNLKGIALSGVLTGTILILVCLIGILLFLNVIK